MLDVFDVFVVVVVVVVAAVAFFCFTYRVYFVCFNLVTLYQGLTSPLCAPRSMAFQPCCSQILYPDIRSPGKFKPIWCGIGYILHWVPTCIYIYMGKLERPHCDLTGIMVNKGNHHQMALIQAP